MTAEDTWLNVDAVTFAHWTRWLYDQEAIVYRLQNDPLFSMQMRLCNEWKMPLSEFLEWGEEDQANALAYFYYEARRCTSCGLHPDDWSDPSEPKYQAQTMVCPGCAELDRHQRWMKEQSETMPASASDGVKSFLKKTAVDG